MLALVLALAGWQASAQPPTDSVRAAPAARAAFTIRRDTTDRVRRPSTFNALATRSLRAQSVVRVAGERWTRRNASRAFGFAQYARVPFTFFGIGRGNDAVEEDFTPETVTLYGEAQRRLGRHWYLGGGLEWAHLRLSAVEAGGVLAADTVLGSRGGRVVSALGLASFDSRDDLFTPYRGGFVQFTAVAAPRAIGGQFGHARVTIDVRSYRAVTRRGVLAGQVVLDQVAGDVPFDRLATIGGANVARGYLFGRFRDRASMAAQGEWRQQIRERIGFVVFGGVAQVGAGTADVLSVTPRPFAGVGARWRLQRQERLNVRVDVGVTRTSRGVYLAVGEAF
ncbi:MAG: outer membrane protein assembly factor [Gemmatimonadaceae bacterium]|nr:outer membrane protein assembly factor [Gemmatimonadaceae bacterium]